MKRKGWNQKALEKLIRHYIDVTGKIDYSPAEIAKWAQENGYTMPEWGTELELLTLLLQRASGRARRRDDMERFDYRATLPYPSIIGGERKMRWCDADGPTVNAEKVLASAHQRKEMALNILASALATIIHHQRVHPKDQLEMFDLSISKEEIEWRLRGRLASDDDQQQDVG